MINLCAKYYQTQSAGLGLGGQNLNFDDKFFACESRHDHQGGGWRSFAETGVADSHVGRHMFSRRHIGVYAHNIPDAHIAVFQDLLNIVKTQFCLITGRIGNMIVERHGKLPRANQQPRVGRNFHCVGVFGKRPANGVWRAVFQHSLDPSVILTPVARQVFTSANVRTAFKINKHELEYQPSNQKRAAIETELGLRAEIVQRQMGEYR